MFVRSRSERIQLENDKKENLYRGHFGLSMHINRRIRKKEIPVIEM